MKKKSSLKKIILNSLKKIDYIKSITFVGSFLNSKNYSDIDIVIIIDSLNSNKFKEIINSLKKVNHKKIYSKKKLIINSSFGPLKFDYKKNLVLHAMIYDEASHKEHALSSPFTCYDWQRYQSSYGYSLKDKYPVLGFGVNDFIGNYRGIENYLKSFNNRSINYKEYQIKNKKIQLIQKKYSLKSKEQLIEFSYHIINNLTNNTLKFLNFENKRFNKNYLQKFHNEIFPKENIEEFNFYFKKILKYKKNLNINIDIKEIDFNTKEYLKNLKNYFKKIKDLNFHITFMRHLKTKIESNIFLGQKLNPKIISKKRKIKNNYDLVFSSQMRRAIQSAKFYKSIVKKNSLLNEINYGKAEGLNIQQFSKKYPKIILSWKKKNDAKFPNGENLLDVEKRMKSFINYIDSKKNENRKILAVSHNVFCRCLIGFFYNVNKYNIYKIYIPYGTKLEFIKLNDKLVPNIKNKKLKIIFRNIHENSYSD